MVRLKGKFEIEFSDYFSEFQFLMVRLKVEAGRLLKESKKNFNSLWCD